MVAEQSQERAFLRYSVSPQIEDDPSAPVWWDVHAYFKLPTDQQDSIELNDHTSIFAEGNYILESLSPSVRSEKAIEQLRRRALSLQTHVSQFAGYESLGSHLGQVLRAITKIQNIKKSTSKSEGQGTLNCLPYYRR